MFVEVQAAPNRFRNYRSVAASVLAHLGLLAVIVFYRPPVVELIPLSLAYGNGAQSYRVIYFPSGDENITPPDAKLTLAPTAHRARSRPRSTAKKPSEDRLPVQAVAEASMQSARAGSPLGTLIDGPIKGHEVKVAYPVVFPDPPVARAELPTDLKGDVIVEVTIDAQGLVVETRILTAIGHGIDEKVIAALRQWRFQPALLDGVPVASKHDVHFHFPS